MLFSIKDHISLKLQERLLLITNINPTIIYKSKYKEKEGHGSIGSGHSKNKDKFVIYQNKAVEIMANMYLFPFLNQTNTFRWCVNYVTFNRS